MLKLQVLDCYADNCKECVTANFETKLSTGSEKKDSFQQNLQKRQSVA